MLAAIAHRDRIPVIMCNQVGGNDSLVFDGSSLALNAHGQLIAQAKSFEEDLVIVDPFDAQPIRDPLEDDTEAAWRALVLGTRDYVRKCGFSKALIALSGGIDSALVAAIAAEALGRENVLCIGMPSPFSSQGSIDDSRALAANLGIRFELIGISDLFHQYSQALEPLFKGTQSGLAEENLQARIRGNLLMALSNKFGSLVLTTGNKSEMAVGYCTLYGDMVGGLAVISDVPKTMVYELSRWVNRDGERIPQNSIDKPPSAELRPDQKDEDSLPPYDVLDRILEMYIEQHMDAEQIAAAGHPKELVSRVLHMVRMAEYKRKQAAPGLIITSKGFGPGRKVPIAQGFIEE
jgi:NAD+ synthase (glutamine-hydrolysing)